MKGGRTVPTGENIRADVKAGSTPEELRSQAQLLRTAASKCRDGINNHGWPSCVVTVGFEGGRQLSIEEAEAYALELERRALAMESLSGKSWANKFGHSTEISALNEPFRQNVDSFLKALAVLKPKIVSTYRSDEHQYLMYWSSQIAYHGVKPEDVPHWPGVDIVWIHKKPNGDVDPDASRAAAQELAQEMGVPPGTAVALPGKSNHADRIAIDLVISWKGDLTVDGMPLRGGTGDKQLDGFNKDLAALGLKYNVKKGQAKGDWMHWSATGT